MSRFFIYRPIFATVIAIVMTLLGAVAFVELPIAQYPDITPPQVRVSASFPGATPATIAETVGQPIEEKVNGVDNMLYMESDSTADGNYQLTVTFELGVDPDMSTVLVQNRVSQAMSRLPQEVQRNGVTTKKQSSAIVAILTASAKDPNDPKVDDTFLSNFVTMRLQDEIMRVPGVGDMNIFPQKDYSMRVWLDPQALDARQVTAMDVVNAIKAQNVQVAAGRVGAMPAAPGTVFDLGVTTQGRLSEPEQFAEIVVVARGGEIIRVGDVAHVEVGGKDYSFLSRRKHAPSVLAIIYQAPGSNAVAVMEKIRDIVERNRPTFPAGVDANIDFDVSNFINASIEEVYHTLFEAFILVALVVLIFLGSWRIAIIPIIAIPVALIATFAAMSAIGFSLNLVTLLGLVLAIGIVVDDAIIVVENVESKLEQGISDVKEATVQAMQEVTGPIIATTLVLMAVFIPASMVPGISGSLFRQFALTIAVSMGFSAINALSLSPALCGVFLKPKSEGHHKGRFGTWFDKVFERITNAFGSMVAFSLRRLMFSLVAVLALLGAAFGSMAMAPTAFVPAEDQGMMFAEIRLPEGATLERTATVLERFCDQAEKVDGVRVSPWVAGFGLMGGRAPNTGFAVVVLDDWGERAKRGRGFAAVQTDLKKIVAGELDARGFTYGMPPIPGLGNGDGFELRVRDIQGFGFDTLGEVTMGLVGAANSQSRLGGVGTTFNPVSPQLDLKIDRNQVMRQGINIQDVFGTLGATLGSTYVNDFNRFARSYQVKVSADTRFRSDRERALGYSVRNEKGEMVPLGAFTRIEDTTFPNRVMRFNMYPAAQMMGAPAPGVSSGDAMKLMEQLSAQELPGGMDAVWTTVSFQQARAGSAGPVFVMAILMVFLVLAAQYESWSLPLAVVLTIPTALLGAVLGASSRAMPIDVFVQAGLVLLVGLAAKNAILIVEFAREQEHAGKSPAEAALTSAKMRFRPIVMTSLAFILGVIPLATAQGAGEISRTEIGTSVLGGMLFNTIFGVLVAPALYVMVRKMSGAGKTSKATDAKPVQPVAPHG